MGVIALPPAGTVYVDACAVIYHVEKNQPYFSAAARCGMRWIRVSSKW